MQPPSLAWPQRVHAEAGYAKIVAIGWVGLRFDFDSERFRAGRITLLAGPQVGTHAGNLPGNLVLDDVIVNADVPEPCSVGLLALVGIALFKRRSRN